MNDVYRPGERRATESAAVDTLDCTGLRCPLPLLRTKQQLARMAPGEELDVVATDAGALRDIPAWIAQTPHQLLARREEGGAYFFRIRRG